MFIQYIKQHLESIGKSQYALIEKSSETSDSLSMHKLFSYYLVRGFLLLALLLIAWFLFSRLPVRYTDWAHSFRPAALHWWNPYQRAAAVFNPPWIFPFLYPLAALPSRSGASLLIIISVLAVAVYTRSMKKTLIIAASAPMVALFSLGQLDALLLFGLMIPRGLGLPILLAKPQGVFLAILPRLNRWSILLTGLVFAVSVLIWGQWWWKILGYHPNAKVNISLFPYSISLGIPLAYLGWKRKSDALLCAGSLCFAPYFMTHSLLPAVAATVRETNDWRWWMATVVGTWLYMAAMKGFLW